MNSSSEIINSGKKANRTGSELGLFVESILIRCGYTRTINKRVLFESKISIKNKQYARNVNVGLLGIPTIIVIDGNGAKRGAIEWLRQQISPVKKSLTGVFNMNEFQKYVNNGAFD